MPFETEEQRKEKLWEKRIKFMTELGFAVFTWVLMAGIFIGIIIISSLVGYGLSYGPLC